MKKLLEIWISKQKIAPLLYISISFTIIIPVILTSYFSVRSYHDELISNVMERSFQTLEQVSHTIDNVAKQFIYTVAAIANDETILKNATLLHETKDSTLQREYSEILQEKISSFFHYTSDVVSAKLLYHNGDSFTYKQQMSIPVNIRNQEWYQRSVSNPKKVMFYGQQKSSEFFGGNHHYLSTVVAPTELYSTYQVAAMVFLFQDNKIQSVLQSRVQSAEQIIILDEHNSIVATNNTQYYTVELMKLPHMQQVQEANEGYFKTIINNEEVFLIYLTSNLGWKYVKLVSYKDVTGQSNQIFYQTMLIIIVSVLIFIVLSLIWVRSIAHPIESLVKEMRAMKKGNLHSNIVASGPLEVHVLGESFNSMIARMKQLIKEKEEKETQKTQAELAALQSQINPHFLVNTLNAIKIMAVMSKADHIKEMTEALTKLLSSTFNRGGLYTRVDEEIELLHHYMHIMKVRYGDTFNFTVHVHPEASELFIIKLLIQPLLENAIIHGVAGYPGRGEVSLTFHIVNKELHVGVKDNGTGMDGFTQEARLREQQLTFSGLGLTNIEKRIQLHYGEQYGLVIHSRIGEGTRIVLRLPILSENLD
ncbi:sensor histidine kinase [Paenibacillus yanchengensis]|uniref:histidine kinase n=1 Tax=Paenibacillus yanchengensis TaxID=2035833 RepID=A0ABW4YKX9_9BACL